MRKVAILSACIILILFVAYRFGLSVFAEQSGSSPESGSTSRIKTGYDALVLKGSNYGSTNAPDWDSAVTYPWGTMWNRIMEAAFWEPDGTAATTDVLSGKTFYAGNGDRTIKTGTANIFDATNQGLQDYSDQHCENNNGESATACAEGDSEYTGEESTWTLTATGGTAQAVTDNSIAIALSSNKVYQDSRTGLYWTDKDETGPGLDNEFLYVDGDDRSSPAGNSCNFNSTGTANAYCDNQDYFNVYAEDNDVSAADFCLNLQLDGDNADGDSNGATGVETDWRLPTQKELMQAYIDGAGNNIPNALYDSWSSTEKFDSQSSAGVGSLIGGDTYFDSKASSYAVRCVRRD